MKHAHRHTHDDGTEHGHFHEHEDRSPDLSRSAGDREAHKAEPHEHEHHTRKVTVEVTFDVGTLEDIGLGGFKVGWLSAEHAGRELDLSAGAGVGSSLLEASVRGPEGQPSVYAQADIRALASALWPQLERVQAEIAAVPSDRPETQAAAGQEDER